MPGNLFRRKKNNGNSTKGVNSNSKKGKPSKPSKNAEKQRRASLGKGGPSSQSQFEGEGRLWFEPGVTVSRFWNDSRLLSRSISVKFTDSMENADVTFSFSTVTSDGLRTIPHVLNGQEYLSYLSLREVTHHRSQESDSWDALCAKFKVRFGVKDISKPEIFGKAAKATLLSILSPFEKSVYNFSQKQYASVEQDKFVLQHSLYGAETLTNRIESFNSKVKDGSKELIYPSGPELTYIPSREILALLKKRETVTIETVAASAKAEVDSGKSDEAESVD